MVSEKMYDKLALLAIKKGVNLQKGQPLVIRANLRDKDFIKKIVKIAYENGAKSGCMTRQSGNRIPRPVTCRWLPICRVL